MARSCALLHSFITGFNQFGKARDKRNFEGCESSPNKSQMYHPLIRSLKIAIAIKPAVY